MTEEIPETLPAGPNEIRPDEIGPGEIVKYANQTIAATPTASVWVSASAGSGKTKVLADRVLRLLLAGTDAGKILCLTFTRAAAAEMQNRIRRLLGEWAVMDDDALTSAIVALTGETPDNAVRALARRLHLPLRHAAAAVAHPSANGFKLVRTSSNSFNQVQNSAGCDGAAAGGARARGGCGNC